VTKNATIIHVKGNHAVIANKNRRVDCGGFEAVFSLKTFAQTKEPIKSCLFCAIQVLQLLNTVQVIGMGWILMLDEFSFGWVKVPSLWNGDYKCCRRYQHSENLE
jgi:hypothetical protein